MTNAPGASGSVQVSAGDVLLDGTGATGANPITAIASDRDSSATGSPSSVTVSSTGDIRVLNGANITSIDSGANVAVSGNVTINARSLTIDSGTSPLTTSIDTESINGSAGNLTVNVDGAVQILHNAVLNSTTFGTGRAGNISLNVGSLLLDGGSGEQSARILNGSNQVSGGIGGSGFAGNITITSQGPVQLLDTADIEANTFGPGNSGNIFLFAPSLTLAAGGSGYGPGISSYQTGSGQGGDILLNISGPIVMSLSPTAPSRMTTSITTSTLGSGTGGNLTIDAQSLSMDAAPRKGAVYITTGNLGSNNDVGSLTINIDGSMTLTNGALVAAGAFWTGNSGDLTITDGSLTLDGGAQAVPTGILSDSQSYATGAAGAVTVTSAGPIALKNGGQITSDTYGAGAAGNVTINARSLTVDGGFGTGTESNNDPSGVSKISTSSNAGCCSVFGGPAGSVAITLSGDLSVTNGGVISSSTSGSGQAGNVSISTPGTISVVGSTQPSEIASSSGTGSLGSPGNVSVSAGTLLVGSNGSITVEDDGSRIVQNLTAPSSIHVNADSIVLDGGAIDAKSTYNVDASSIDITYGKSLTATDSSITTSAGSGNGGPIAISGTGILWLKRTQITTSVTDASNDGVQGSTSNGGDIQISAPFIIMDSAAIQANTNISLASGGNVNIQARGIVPSYGSFILGGAEQTFDASQPGLNLVQAVAPNGVSGALNVTTPTLDIGNSLVALKGVPAAIPTLGRSPCSQTAGNTLSVNGRGGLQLSSRGPLWLPLDPDVTAESEPNTATNDRLRDLPQLVQLPPCTNSATTTTSPSSPSSL